MKYLKTSGEFLKVVTKMVNNELTGFVNKEMTEMS